MNVTIIEDKISYDYDMPPIYYDYNDGYDSFTSTINNEKDFASVESNNTYMMVDEKDALCGGYIIEFSYDATESYYERGKHGYINFRVIKFPLFMLKVLMLHLFYPSMLLALCFIDLFS